MSFIEADLHNEKQALGKLVENDPEARKAVDTFEAAYELHRALVNARIAKGVTQVELAAKMGTSQQSISRFENGSSGSLGFAIKYAGMLGYCLVLKEN